MDNNQKALSHYGIPGMRWGRRKSVASVSRTLDSESDTWKSAARRAKAKADYNDAYAFNRTKADGTINGSVYKKINVSNAKARSERLNEKSTKQQNVAKGIDKAKKLVKNMDMKQSIATLQKAAGYSRGKKIYTKLTMDKKTQLKIAAVDYSFKTTNSGTKNIDAKK